MEHYLTTQHAARYADRAALNKTHAALVGVPFPDDVSDAAASTRLCMLILHAKHLQPDADCPVTAVIQKGIRMKNIYPEGTLAHQLAAEVIANSAPRVVAEPKQRKKFSRVRATGQGSSKGQAGSIRTRVLELITAAGKEGISLDALDKAIEGQCRGHVQKLIDKNHVEIIEDEK